MSTAHPVAHPQATPAIHITTVHATAVHTTATGQPTLLPSPEGLMAPLNAEHGASGWYDSSWELKRGVDVREVRHWPGELAGAFAAALEGVFDAPLGAPLGA